VQIVWPDPPPGTAEHTVSVIVRDAGNAVVIQGRQQMRLEEFAPNGERCGPVCWSGAANFQ
jgi:hypothetical protein